MKALQLIEKLTAATKNGCNPDVKMFAGGRKRDVREASTALQTDKDKAPDLVLY